MEFRQGVPQDRDRRERDGVAVSPMKVTGETEKRGTEVHFLPDLEIFSNIDFHYDILASGCASSRSSTTACSIRLIDERNNKEDDFAFAGGVKGFVEFINTGKKVLHPNVFHADRQKAQRPGHRPSRPKSRCSGTTATARTCSASPTTSRSATAAPTSPACARR